MFANRLRRRHRALGACAASAVALAAGVSLSAPAVAQSSGHGSISYQVHPIAEKYDGQAFALPPTADCIKHAGLACDTPAQIRAAYDIPPSWTGAGQKIAIIDAYGSPTVQPDLNMSDQAFGLPDTKVNIVCPMGCPATMTAHQGQPQGWAGETSLDVQWAHAIAPGAQINLVVAPNNNGNALNNAVRYAVDNKLGDVISMSYGADESAAHGNNLQIKQAHRNFQAAVNAGISLFASAGDYGATDTSSTITAGYPSSDPLVTAVGGTDLHLNDNGGGYGSETVWNDTQPATCPFNCTRGAFGATGGAESNLFQAPPYQRGASGYSTRTSADVAYNASVYTGVWVYLGFNANPSDNGFYFMGGTSAGSPQWAAIGALANQQAGHDLGQLNPKLYGIYGTSDYSNDFHDVTAGDNDWYNQPGYSAGPGYDIPTGLGSPDVKNLVTTLTQADSSP